MSRISAFESVVDYRGASSGRAVRCGLEAAERCDVCQALNIFSAIYIQCLAAFKMRDRIGRRRLGGVRTIYALVVMHILS